MAADGKEKLTICRIYCDEIKSRYSIYGAMTGTKYSISFFVPKISLILIQNIKECLVYEKLITLT